MLYSLLGTGLKGGDRFSDASGTNYDKVYNGVQPDRLAREHLQTVNAVATLVIEH